MNCFKWGLKTVLIAAFLLVCSMLSASALADESGDWRYDVTAEGMVITGYTGTNTEVEIPAEIDGFKVTVIGRKAFANNTAIKSVTIPEGVSSIKAEAFYGCSGLNRIFFNAKNCSVPEIWTYSDEKGVGVFSGAGSASAQGLTVVFGPSVTRVPDRLFETASIDEYGHRGYPYAYVTSVVFSDKIKEIGASAFRNCRELTGVTIGSKTTAIGAYAFYSCVSLTDVAFSDAVAFIGDYAFAECSSLTDVTWPGELDTIGSHAFSGCTSLVEAHLPTPLSTIQRGAFAGCTALRTVTLPETLTSLGAEAFFGDIRLGEINYQCSLCTVPEIWVYSDSKGVGVFSGAGSGSTKGLKVSFGDHVTKIPAYLFDTASLSEYGHNGYAYAYVTSVELGASVKEIGAYAFRNCRELDSLTLNGKLQKINEGAFQDCSSLTDLVIADQVAQIGPNAFNACSALENISFGAGMDMIGDSAFQNCASLVKLKITNPVTSIGFGAFSNCSALKEIELPESLTYLGGEAFRDCSKLSVIRINSKMLQCPAVWIYDSKKGIGIFAGAGSSAVDGMTVTFGNEVQSVPASLFDTASIDEYGHTGYDYAYLTSVHIPESVMTVGEFAFRGCKRLATVNVMGIQTEFAANTFAFCVTGSEDAAMEIQCPDNSKAKEYAVANQIKYSITQDETVAVPAADHVEGWTCSNGHSGIMSNFCPECGEAKPREPVCSFCGYVFEKDIPNFCPNCGAKQ